MQSQGNDRDLQQLSKGAGMKVSALVKKISSIKFLTLNFFLAHQLFREKYIY